MSGSECRTGEERHGAIQYTESTFSCQFLQIRDAIVAAMGVTAIPPDRADSRGHGAPDPAGAPPEPIASRILVVRGQRVLLDAELARLYGVSTGRLNEQ